MRHLFQRKSLTFLLIAAFLVGGFFVFTGNTLASTLTVESNATNQAYYNAIVNTANRLVTIQSAAGSWDWVVTNSTNPSTVSLLNITGVTAEGLLSAYKITGNHKYLDAAKLSGDFIITEIDKSSPKKINGYNILFLQKLSVITGDTNYSDKALEYFNTIYSNKATTVCPSGCIDTAGLVAGQKVVRSATVNPQGIVLWDLVSYVEYTKLINDNTHALEIGNAIIAEANSTNYVTSVPSYDLGLSAALKAAVLLNDNDNKTTISSRLISSDNGSFDSEGIQTTSYALRALKLADLQFVKTAEFLISKSAISGVWLDGGDEYAEVDSEAITALADLIPQTIQYYDIPTAVGDAKDNDVINVAEGNYTLLEQLNISKPISLVGQGNVNIKADNNVKWPIQDGSKHLLLINSGTNLTPITFSNIILDTAGTYGLNTYNNAYGILNDVTIKNSKGAGLTVNGSTIEATNLNISNNAWGSINIDPGSGVLTPSILTLKSGILLDNTKIWSDGEHVTNVATVTVDANGYESKEIAGSLTGGKYWVKVTTTVKDVTELKAALADTNIKTINIEAGTYELTEQIQITRPITIKGIGKVIITPAASFTAASNPEKNLISINGVSGLVSIENLTFDKSKRSGINTWESTNVELKDIFSTNNVAGGLIVNNSAVTATNFNTSGNGWGYGINVDNGSKPSIGAPKTVLTFNSGTLSEATQIVSDNSGDIQVIATGYFPHQIEGTTKTIWTNRTLTENYQFLGDTTTVSTSTAEILVGGSNTGTSTVNIPSNVTNATMNLSALATSTATSTIAKILGAININASTTLGVIGVGIPAGIQITADVPDWNGILNTPTIKENSTVTATPDNGKNATVSSVIEIGYGDVKLTFDKAVKIVFPGQAGKEIGYSRDGVFTKIETNCATNTQEVADLLPLGGDCKITVGSDLVIWTKHFTKFATYTQTTKSNGGGGGGGGGGASYCASVVYSDWGACINGHQYRVITKPSEYCSLSVKQQLDSSRPCIIPATPAIPGIKPATPATPAKPITRKEVLGEKKYADGTLLKGTNNRIYVVKGDALQYVASLKELAKYRGPVLKVSNDIINSFSQTAVLGAKQYANGTLIKAKGDVKIYVIKDGKKVHIRSLAELRKQKGKTLTVEASELNNY